MAEFAAAYKVIFGNEVGYANDKTDRGGETMNGITRKNYPTWSGWAIVDAHKPLEHGDTIPELDSLTKQFYKSTQWDKCLCDGIDSQEIATFICDWYVNSGGLAIKHVQHLVGVSDDGIMGDNTLHAINGYHEVDLLAKLKADRKLFYVSIVDKDPSQRKFLKGWLDRADRLA